MYSLYSKILLVSLASGNPILARNGLIENPETWDDEELGSAGLMVAGYVTCTAGYSSLNGIYFRSRIQVDDDVNVISDPIINTQQAIDILCIPDIVYTEHVRTTLMVTESSQVLVSRSLKGLHVQPPNDLSVFTEAFKGDLRYADARQDWYVYHKRGAIIHRLLEHTERQQELVLERVSSFLKRISLNEFGVPRLAHFSERTPMLTQILGNGEIEIVQYHDRDFVVITSEPSH